MAYSFRGQKDAGKGRLKSKRNLQLSRGRSNFLKRNDAAATDTLHPKLTYRPVYVMIKGLSRDAPGVSNRVADLPASRVARCRAEYELGFGVEGY